MKFRLLLIILISFSFRSVAQLSTDETIIYIEDKINECADLTHTYESPKYYRINNLRFGYSSTEKNKLVFQITKFWSIGAKTTTQYIFDPSQINSFFDFSNAHDAIYFLSVDMIGATVIVRTEQNGTLKETNSSSFKIPFLKFNTLDSQRLRKALLHLKKIYTAKKGADPFAN
jgi:hypothetical protein